MTYGSISEEGSDTDESSNCHASLDTKCCKSAYTPVTVCGTFTEKTVSPQTQIKLTETPSNRNNCNVRHKKSLKIGSAKLYRVKKSQQPEKSVPQSQMTVERPMAFLGPLQRGMEKHVRYSNTDQSLQPDAWSPEQTSVYAASPTSLYMQEQEKNDMQSTFTGYSTPNSCTFSNEEQELKPQFEVSLDITSMTSVSSKSNILGESSLLSSNPFTSTSSTWCSTSQVTDDPSIKIEDIFQLNENSDLLGPTLAELNASESTLLDENENPESMVSTFASPSSSVSTLSCTTMPISTETLPVTVKTEPTNNNPCTQTVPSHEWNYYKSDFLKNTSGKSDFSSTMSTHMRNRLIPSWPYGQRTPVSQAETLLASSVYNSAGYQQNYTSSNHPSHTSTNSSHQNDNKLTLQQLLLSGRQQTSRSSSVSSAVSSRKRTASETTLDPQDNLEDRWKEIEEFIHEDSKDIVPVSETSKYSRIGKRTRFDSGSTVYSYDEDYDDSDDDLDSDLDSDLEDFSDSDSIGSQGSLLTETTQTVGRNKEKQYFWQYNVQSKGPKGAKLDLRLSMDDPHILSNFEDPVFDPENSSVIGVRHRGNARKGDGNEVTPNAKKLYQIGLQLRKLTRQINGIQPSDLPSSARNKSRKEKNKLASRACRLKKKAQHEANKVKLYGLELEQKQLVEVLVKIKKALVERIKICGEDKPSQLYEMSDKKPLSPILEETIKTELNVMIAGNATDYVNSVIKQVEEGDSTGGIPKHVKKKHRLSFMNTG